MYIMEKQEVRNVCKELKRISKHYRKQDLPIHLVLRLCDVYHS